MASLSVCLQEAETEEPRPQLGHGSLALLVEFGWWFHNEGGLDVHQLNCVPWRTIVYKGGNGTKHARGWQGKVGWYLAIHRRSKGQHPHALKPFTNGPEAKVPQGW